MAPPKKKLPSEIDPSASGNTPPSKAPTGAENAARQLNAPTAIGAQSGVRFTPPATRPRFNAAQGTVWQEGINQFGGTFNVRYLNGDEWRPMNTPQIIPTLQSQMVAAGFLTEKTFRPGMWDEKSATAYKNVLQIANQNGISAAQALSLAMSNPTLAQLEAASGGGGGGGGGRTITLANPQDLRAVANEVAPKTIGRRLSDQELSKFTAAFHGVQGTGGNPPSLDVAATDFAESVDPGAAQARDLVGVFDVVLNMMKGGGQ